MASFLGRVSIRYKLLQSYGAACIVALVLGYSMLYLTIRRGVERDIEHELTNTTAIILNMVQTATDVSIKNHLRSAAETNRDIVRYFYEESRAGRMSVAEAKDAAAEVLLSQKIGTTGYVYCVDSDGVMRVHPRENLLGHDLSGNDFIRRQTRRREGYLSYDWANPGERSPRPKALYMTYFQPWDWIISASSYRDEFERVIDVGDFRDSILDITFGKTGYPYVIDSKGNLIIHPKLEGTNIYDSEDSTGRKFIQELCRKKNGKIIYPWRNPGEPDPREKLVIFNYIPELDWIVASSSYLEEFYEPLRTLGYTSLAMIALTVVLLVPFTMWLSASLTRPLENLMAGFSRGAEGDLSHRIEVKTEDEIGQLGTYYNTFMEQLAASRHELEQRVEERTTELSSWVDELERLNRNRSQLQEMGNMIQLCRSTEETYPIILRFLDSFFPEDHASLYVHDAATATLAYVPTGPDTPIMEATACWALRQGKSYRVNADHDLPICPHLTEEAPHGYCCTPLVAQGELIGLVHIVFGTDSAETQDRTLRLANSIADNLALALANLELRETLRLQSIQDPLTSLYNRRYLEEAIQQEVGRAVRRKRSLGVLMLDIDHFKQVNDNHGHDVGDAVLRELGAYLGQHVRAEDIACRYGGEEFAVILNEMNEENLRLKGEEIRQAVERDVHVPAGGTTLHVTVSVGAALFPNHADSARGVVKAADEALYEAKRRGRNRVVMAGE